MITLNNFKHMTEETANKYLTIISLVVIAYLSINFNSGLYFTGQDLQKANTPFTYLLLDASYNTLLSNHLYADAFSLWVGYNL